MNPIAAVKKLLRRTGLRTVWVDGRRRALRARAIVTKAWLLRRARFSRRSLLGVDPVVVSLTSHGRRVQDVAVTIESIGAGRLRPRRLILWLDDRAIFDDLPELIRRQQGRGLEVMLTDNYGPHTKYFPYVRSLPGHQLPLVTADDDIIYPRYWLERLYDAYVLQPDAVACYRANVVRLDGDRLAGYDTWPRSRDTIASVVRFATGVSGVIYPPAMLDELSARGDAFRATTPRADDVWLHWVALQTGRLVRQISDKPRHFAMIPGSQADGLVVHNVGAGGNDAQIQALYTAADAAILRRAGA